MNCESCGKPVTVPEDWPVDWVICRECSNAAKGES